MAKVYIDETVPYEARIADLAKLVDECDARHPGKKLKFDQFGLHTTLLVKTRQAL